MKADSHNAPSTNVKAAKAKSMIADGKKSDGKGTNSKRSNSKKRPFKTADTLGTRGKNTPKAAGQFPRTPGRKTGSAAVAVRRNALIRQSIVEASAKVFATNGYAATTMEEIAGETGFSPSSLYGYFPGKEAVYLFLLELLSAKVIDVFNDPLLGDLAFFERVSWVLRRIFRMVEQNPELFEILFMGLRLGPKTSEAIVETGKLIERDMLEAFTRQLKIGQEEGWVVQGNAEDLAVLLRGSFQSWIARWRQGDMAESLQESFPRFLSLIRPMLIRQERDSDKL